MGSSQNNTEQFLAMLGKLIVPYRNRFEEVLQRFSSNGEFGNVEELKKASEYALASGGKRFRPAIVWMIGDALGCPSQEILDNAAFAVEYFHTASLIADDLPCMDNDDFRRGIPTTHKAFSEATAVLVSFSLIALGFQAIARSPVASTAHPDTHKKAILEASRTMGACGLLGGQSIDLNPPDADLETIHDIIDMKTGALFDLSFTLGWLFGGGHIDKIDEVHSLARDFGRAFQILDDIDDIEKDRASNKMINYALRFGVDEAVTAIDRYVASALRTMEKLGMYLNVSQDSQSLVLLTQLLSQHAHALAGKAC